MELIPYLLESMTGFYPEWAESGFALLRLLIIAMTLIVVLPIGSGLITQKRA
jgi:hypothetical protein